MLLKGNDVTKTYYDVISHHRITCYDVIQDQRAAMNDELESGRTTTTLGKNKSGGLNRSFWGSSWGYGVIGHWAETETE